MAIFSHFFLRMYTFYYNFNTLVFFYYRLTGQPLNDQAWPVSLPEAFESESRGFRCDARVFLRRCEQQANTPP